jgi:hypothetical protein
MQTQSATGRKTGNVEVRWMKTILKRTIITPGNYQRIAARIVPQDQRDAIRPGLAVSHYAFTDRHGQPGYLIISHTTRRAGICFGEERTRWGWWDGETWLLTVDDGRLYNCGGEEVAGGYSDDERTGSHEA